MICRVIDTKDVHSVDKIIEMVRSVKVRFDGVVSLTKENGMCTMMVMVTGSIINITCVTGIEPPWSSRRCC